MFRAHCDAEDREVLLTTRRIRSLALCDGANVIAFTCWCGHEGLLVDRAVPRPHAPPAPIPHSPPVPSPDPGIGPSVPRRTIGTLAP